MTLLNLENFSGYTISDFLIVTIPNLYFQKIVNGGGLFTGIDELIDYSGTDQGVERDNCIHAH